MRRDVKVHNTSSIVCEDDKDKQDFKPNRMDCKEVDRSELRNMIIEERLPRLRRRFGTSNHVFGNGSLGNLNAQLHQLAVNARCAPKRVLSVHCSDQIANLLRNSRASWLSVTNLPSPVPTESL